MRIEEIISKQAQRMPNRWAIADSRRRLTYREWTGEVEERVRELRRAGAGAAEGEIFSLQRPNSIEWVTDMLAVLALGGIIMPLHPETTDDERDKLFASVPPHWMLRPDEVRRQRPAPASQLPLRQTESVKDLFLIGYTSGSTGKPKGYVKSHRSWTCGLEGWTESFRLGDKERIVVPLPMSYSAQLYPAVHGLATGAEVLLMDNYTPEGLLAYEATCVTITPALIDSLLRYSEKRLSPNSRNRMPRTVISVGAKLSPSQRWKFESCFNASSLYEYYGSSEMGYVTLVSPEDAKQAPDTVGCPFPGVEIAFLDDKGRLFHATEDFPGKLYVRTLQAFEGYASEQELTEESWNGEWVTSHDLGYRRKDGRIVLVGRDRDVIKSGGSLIHAAEIEAVLIEIEGVEEAAVLGEDDETRGEIIHAVLVLEEPNQLSWIKRQCALKLAPHKRPRKWSILKELPKNRNGKVAKRLLKEYVEAGAAAEM